MHQLKALNQSPSLYRPDFEKENCGFGMIANLDDQASHTLVNTAIQSLSKMTHRGGVAADCCSGDGCGLLIKKPDAFFRRVALEQNLELPEQYAVAMVFFHKETAKQAHAKAAFDRYCQEEGLNLLLWRKVPVNSQVLGSYAASLEPDIEQVFLNADQQLSLEDFERKLFTARRLIEKAIESEDEVFYIASMSAELVSYKGLVMPSELTLYYQDLVAEDFASSCVSYHQRFSTNTLPQWRLAQPFRRLAHNGEINTIRGNRNWARARETLFATPNLPRLSELQPVVSQTGSDSSSLDNLIELLTQGGMDIFSAMRMVVPPAWQNVNHMNPDLRAFLDYSSMHMEPWDGPAGMVINTGRYAICAVDRNGLRPTRYVITKDRHITFASEIGVYDYAPEDVVEKGRLKPGQIMAADLATGELLNTDTIDMELQSRHDYRQWMDEGLTKIEVLPENESNHLSLEAKESEIYQKYFQISFEERDQILRVLAEQGEEATGSMGDDAPYPVFSKQTRSLFDYFRQMFAQVTNPPIDPLREKIVMSLTTCIGREQNLFEATADHAYRLEIPSPVLMPSEFKQLVNQTSARYSHSFLPLHYDPSNIPLETALETLAQAAVDAIEEGKTILWLSDRDIQPGLVTIPAAMATGAVHHRLTNKGIRWAANILVETGAARDPHHFAVLIGYGATAVYPYMAYETIADLMRTKELNHESFGFSDYASNYRYGINKGLYKILSKMGISTVTSYRGSQLFEIVGLHDEIVQRCFAGTTSRIQGARFTDLEADLIQLSKEAFNPRKALKQGGLLKYVYGGEAHAFNPAVVDALRYAVKTGDPNDYQKFADLVNNRDPMVIRDLLKVKFPEKGIALEEVEPIESILKRFDSAGISLGALSPEAHEALAIAMNRLGARSNSGEGAEDPARYGTEKMSKIKQIASGRFGVTAEYLVNAEVLQIKVAQGAKPGEGGQLPGHKVNKMIAQLRHCVPGVTLISPPPHHDIYSIEDLAQLIFDLKQVNPAAKVSVKLVAEPGVGTIAAGVAKAYADLITISGYDGGTGASPVTSVKYAGSPFELGISEAHQILRANDLRGQVILQADGGLKSGLDVIKAAMLGAESFGFGTAPMIALGCKYLRICHLNTCAVGVATQDERLRKDHFQGTVEHAMNYFKFVAEETRQWMAKLGIRTLEELVGRVDLLEVAENAQGKMRNLDLTPVISDGGVDPSKPHTNQVDKNNPWDTASKAHQMLKDLQPVIDSKMGGIFHYTLANTDRSIGAMISGAIAKKWGNKGMASSPITLKLKGIAGQSFGVFNVDGLHLHLEGDANDYVGKGMAGGEIVIFPPKGSAFDPHTTPIVGNTCLYGATGGYLFANGTGGERFGVRNSGAIAVVEGLGDHGCEYMTGGTVVSLGEIGINFGAGMSGGMAFLYDPLNVVPDSINPEMVEPLRIDTGETLGFRQYLLSLIEAHEAKTGSQTAKNMVNDFSRHVTHFWLIKPKSIELENLLRLFGTRAA